MKPSLLLATMALTVSLSGQETVQLPPLTITGTTIDAKVTYDSARGVYRYGYTIVAPASNKANLGGFSIDVSGTVERPQLDPDLQNNVPRPETRGTQLQPNTTIPVGIIMPDPNGWYSMLSIGGRWGFFPNDVQWEIVPGNTATGFILESKFPPALRDVLIGPDESAWDTIEEQYEHSNAIFQPETSDQFEIHLKVPAPAEPSDASLYPGGGQQPAEVNKFLRYASPTEHRVKLPAGTTSFTVIVYYGHTIKPASFTATLNGAGIGAQFQAIPGTAQVVKIPLASGTTKLQLTVEGTKSSGQTARDSDTLTFIVP